MNRRQAIALAAAGLCRSARAANAARLSLIRTRMEEAVARRAMPGAVTLVAHEGKVVHHEAVGFQDLDKKTPMRKDTIFQIMSMTKPVTGTAVMMLAEEGKLALTDTVAQHLPEFRGQMMIASRGQDGSLTLKKPARAITIRDLMTHTSGLPEYPPEGVSFLTGSASRTLADVVLACSQMPLLFEPGTKWQYSNPGIATLGRIVELRSGMPYEKFLEDRLFTPLGMPDTFFFPPESKHARIADVQVEGPAAANWTDPAYWKFRRGWKYPMPEGGLFSTAADLANFYQMFLNGGVFNGKRYLSKASVEVMTKWHNPGMTPAAHSPGQGYGLSWAVVKEPLGELLLNAQGAYAHGGAFGTLGMVDPKRQAVYVFLVQRIGGSADTGRAAFLEIANAALTE
jgi:CubicO group peptidase (beta-lactamase class C family)